MRINLNKSIIIRITCLLILIISPIVFISGSACTQDSAFGKVTGTFSSLANQPIKLVGYNGFDTYPIDSTKANSKGKFSLDFAEEDCGMGYLMSEYNKSFIVILAENENLQLAGENFELTNRIKVINGKQNLLFELYASEQARREQTYSAWDYLSKIYKQDSLFSIHVAPKQAIETEKKRIRKEDSLFLASLPQNTYIDFYLPMRKLISLVAVIAQYRPEEIPATFVSFRNLDYTDSRLHKSGLLKDAIESHFWLIENSGRSLDSVYVEMQISIDYMLESLMSDEPKLNEVTEYLFKLLEKRSLFTALEYLAIRLLNNTSFNLSDDLASQLESYRAMKKGNIVPEITFAADLFAPGYANGNVPKTLSEVEANYKVVVFGASWCPQCTGELQTIAQLYPAWKKEGVEVVLISLDEDKQAFANFAKPFSFISTCDYQKWEGQTAKDYHLFATPTIYLLNKQHEIVLKPNSVSQLDGWIDWYLVQRNAL